MQKLSCLLLIFIAVFIHSNLSAQEWNKGFVINMQKDTLHGYVADFTDADMARGIDFRSATEERSVHYSAEDLQGFGFSYGRVFEQVAFTDSLKDTVKVFAKRVENGRIRALLWRKNKWTDFDLFLLNEALSRSVQLTEPVKSVTETEKGLQETSYRITHVGLLKYIKGDSGLTTPAEKRLRYSEKRLLEDIHGYNLQNPEPVAVYKERLRVNYEITVGMPVISAPDGVAFRVAGYAHLWRPEKNRSFSILGGLSFRHWNNPDPVENTIENDGLNKGQNWISLIPAGLHIHSAKGVIRPYFYCGVGLSLLISEQYVTNGIEPMGTETDLLLLPALNIGAGVRARVGSNFLLVEITPTGNRAGIFANLGFSF